MIRGILELLAGKKRQEEPKKRFTSIQACLFIKTINETADVYVTDEYLDIFDTEVISYAVNLARKNREDGKERTDWNQFCDKQRYMRIIDYLRKDRSQYV